MHALIDRSRLGEFDTCKALLTLVNEGYIEPNKVKKARETPGQRVSRGALVTRILVNLVVVGAIVAGAILLPGAQGEIDSNARAVGIEARYRLRSNRIVAVSEALEAHRIQYGSYPASLDTLVTAGLIDARALAGEVGLDYVSTGSNYDLR